MVQRLAQSVGMLLVAAGLAGAAGPDAGPLLARIKAVGREGKGNVEAARAWRQLVGMGTPALPATLAAIDNADPTAANWLRSAVDAVAEHALADGKGLPTGTLEKFVRDTRHSGTARRLAYEWLVRADPATPGRLLPGMLNDPGAELRRDAVARAMGDARKLVDKKDKAAATAAFRRLFDVARDRDQVDEIANQLKALGAAADVTAHYGFLTHWLVVGPFDNTDGKGFATAYPPERHIDLAATYEGKKGARIHWVEHTTPDPYGQVDLNKILGKHMAAVGYAFVAVDAPRVQPVEVRASSNNAVKLFLNGKEIFFREEYHHGTRMDQHVGRGTLKPGRNEVLIKVCQNDQKEEWAQLWGFQLRLCDALGGAVAVKARDEKPGDRQARGAKR